MSDKERYRPGVSDGPEGSRRRQPDRRQRIGESRRERLKCIPAERRNSCSSSGPDQGVSVAKQTNQRADCT